MKKKLTAVLLVVSLIALMVAGATVAYFKDTDSAVNVFTMGNVDITLHEDNGDANTLKADYKLDEAYEDWIATQDFLPTVTLPKEAWVANTGSEQAYVRIFVIYPEAVAEMIELPVNVTEFTEATWKENGDVFTFADTGIEIPDANGVKYVGNCLVYNDILESGKITPNVINTITLKSDVECETLADGSVLYTYVDTYGTEYTYNDPQGDFPVFVVAQAGQVTNQLDPSDPEYWDNANDALNVMFGNPTNLLAYFDDFYKDVAAGTIAVKGTVLYEIPSDAVNYTIDGSYITKVGDYAANGNTELTSVVITEGVTTIGNRAFRRTSALGSVTLPSTLTTIEESAFQESAITSIEIPEGVTTIGKQAFYSAPLTELKLPSTLTRIEEGAFRNLEITELVIPETVKSVGNFAFRACSKLENVYIKSADVEFDDSSMIFSREDTGKCNGMNIYVMNDAVAADLRASMGSATDYNIIVDPSIVTAK